MIQNEVVLAFKANADGSFVRPVLMQFRVSDREDLMELRRVAQTLQVCPTFEQFDTAATAPTDSRGKFGTNALIELYIHRPGHLRQLQETAERFCKTPHVSYQFESDD